MKDNKMTKIQNKQLNKQIQYKQHSLLLNAGRNGTGRAAGWLYFAVLSSEITHLALLTVASQANGGKATSPPVKGSPSQSSNGQAHQLLQTAAARLLMVLTDSSLWKCFQPGKQTMASPFSLFSQPR